MKCITKLFWNFGLLFVLLHLFCLQTLAVEEFNTDLNIDYLVLDDASIKVTENITLTNNLNNVYVKEYSFTFGKTKINDLKAWDSFGSLDPKIEKITSGQKINLNFNQPAVGLGNKYNFTLSFITPDFSHKNGQVLQIGLPKISQINEYDSCNVNLYVPSQFAKPYLMLPTPRGVTENNDYILYQFNKKDLENQAIFASFGQSQVFNFSLSYIFTNKLGKDQTISLAMPPDTPYQKMYYERITPQPKKIIVDNDGNWLADFTLPKNSTVNIMANGAAEIFLKPQNNQNQLLSQKLDWLTPQKYWEVEDLEIKQIANGLQNVESIFNYVVDKLDYNYERLNQEPVRLGAKIILSNPQNAICQEFTDLFVTLCRAKGIPARQVTGFAYTNNEDLKPLGMADLLHSWPEYYDEEQKIWIPVDPTWTKTTDGIDYFHTFDLEHFSFVFHGLNSQFPGGPGVYKDDWVKKDFQINFGDKPQLKKKYQVELTLPKTFIAGQDLNASVKISNFGNTAQYQAPFSYSVSGAININREQLIPILIPYNTVSFNLNLGKTSLFSKGDLVLNYQFEGEKGLSNSKIFSLLDWPLLAIGIALVSFLFFLVLCLRKLRKNG